MKRMSWVVNKRGFGSLYALGLLWIVVAFVILMITQAITFAKTQTANQSLHFAQLYAIYHVKAHLVQIRDEEAQEEEIIPEEDGEIEEEIIEDVVGFPTESEVCTYDNQMITITYQEQQAIVVIDSFSFTLTVDFEQGEILELAYS